MPGSPGIFSAHVGGLIRDLKICDLQAEVWAKIQNKPVELPRQLSAKLSSYRGYYEDLAVEPVDGDFCPPCTVSELRDALTAAVGTRFEGYKGGQFLMTKDTDIWVSEHGRCDDWAVVRATMKEGRCIIVVTDEYD